MRCSGRAAVTVAVGDHRLEVSALDRLAPPGPWSGSRFLQSDLIPPGEVGPRLNLLLFLFFLSLSPFPLLSFSACFLLPPSPPFTGNPVGQSWLRSCMLTGMFYPSCDPIPEDRTSGEGGHCRVPASLSFCFHSSLAPCLICLKQPHSRDEF